MIIVCNQLKIPPIIIPVKCSGSHTVKISETDNAYYFCTSDSELDNIIQIDAFMSEEYIDYEGGRYCKYFIAVYSDEQSEHMLSIHYGDGLNKLRNDETPIAVRIYTICILLYCIKWI